MRIWIDTGSRIPPYEQLRAQLRLMVSSGRLKPGERLPPIRVLAQELNLAPGTVARAYREMEWAGIVEGRGRAGTFVVDEPPVAFSVLERQLAGAAEAFVAEADRLGVGLQAAMLALESAFAARSDPDPGRVGT
ncbi:GntR family transcriptional regulator [Candidatus Poriferisocius sp.]|uniref:GntR family transcriptional regulator n=1 Tax=Candidatus Poriferisocius sp. TaxID=3101276 RepID=UPI003B01401F